MKIVADENIAQVAAGFGGAGELVLMPGRAIDAQAVADADALLVRSVTRIDSTLLSGSRCRFVGTATSGIDHVDTDWLQQQGIGFGWAQGCNARSVVDYVFSVLAHLSLRDSFDWRALSFGIVGCGQIGSRLARQLQALRIRIAVHDPFLDGTHPSSGNLTDFATVLQQDVVTFHTPLTRSGPWPTLHMLDAHGLARLRPDTILINAARGGVIDNVALLAHLKGCQAQRVVLDAWENEPAIDLQLLERVALGTPHIAGYSQEGKLKGTRMIADAFRRHFGVQLPNVTVPGVGANAKLAVDGKLPGVQQLNQLILQVYDASRDDALLRQTQVRQTQVRQTQVGQALGTPDPAAQFDLLRKRYPVRHEFAEYYQPPGLDPEVGREASRLGFRSRLPIV